MAWKVSTNSRKLEFSRALSFKILKKKKTTTKQTWNSTQNQNIGSNCAGKRFFSDIQFKKNYLPNTLCQIPAGGYSPKFKRPKKRNI